MGGEWVGSKGVGDEWMGGWVVSGMDGEWVGDEWVGGWMVSGWVGGLVGE